MLTRLEARVVAFFTRPGVQSVIRHIVVTAVAAAVAVIATNGIGAVGTAAGAALVLRAVWVAIRPIIAADVVPPVEEAAKQEIQEVVTSTPEQTKVEISGAS